MKYKYSNTQKEQIILSAFNGVIAADNDIMEILEESTYYNDLRSIPNTKQLGTQDLYLATLNKDTILYIMTPY